MPRTNCNKTPDAAGVSSYEDLDDEDIFSNTNNNRSGGARVVESEQELNSAPVPERVDLYSPPPRQLRLEKQERRDAI